MSYKFLFLVFCILLMASVKGQGVRYRFARPTQDLQASVNFYTKALHLKKIDEFYDHDNFDGVILGLPDEEYQLEFVYHPNFKKEEVCAPSNENLLVFYHQTQKSYQKAIERMEKYGAKKVISDNPYWNSNGLTFVDPEGWRIVFVQPK